MKSTNAKAVGIKSVEPRREDLTRPLELQILYDIFSALYSSPNLHDVLKRALSNILVTLKFNVGMLYLVKEMTGDNWLFELAAHHAHQGFSSTMVDCIENLTLSDKSMSSYNGQAPVRWFPIAKIVFPWLREYMKEHGVGEMIGIALMSHDELVGLLYVSNDGAYKLGAGQGELLRAIGNQLGIFIQNARLFDSIERGRRELEISFDAIQDAIFLVGKRERIFRMNRTSEMVYGPGLVGRNYPEVIYGTERPHKDCPIKACLDEGLPVRREGPHPRWGGYYQFHVFPVINVAGDLERVIYFEKDVTEAKKLDERLQQSERLKALGTLAAGIAHEIRNPLATINFNTQMLRRELKLQPAQSEMFEDIFEQIRRMDRIIQQVLHYARPSDPQFLPASLNEVVGRCLDMTKMYTKDTRVDVTVDLQQDLPLIVMDFNQISQVLMNLIINSIEAMPDGGKLSISTSLRKDGGQIFEIHDSGTGILEEDKGRIFDPFFTRKPEGTGMGLSISRQIIEKHGALMEVDSVPGEGTTFRLIFPLAMNKPAVSSGGK
jgi:signal transduction histidine kinase